MSRQSTLAGTGFCFVLGGACSLAWGGWLLAELPGPLAAVTTADVLAAVARLGRAGDLLMLAATLCWLLGLVRLTAERRRRLRPVHLVLPAVGEGFYLAAMAVGFDGTRWPLAVPPGALGTLCWSLGMCLIGAAALRSPHWRGPVRYLPLAIGLFFPLVTLPAFAALGHPPLYLTGLGWGVLWSLLGAALWRAAADRPRRPTRAGDVYENPATGERVVVRRGTLDGDGTALVADLYLRPGAAVPGEHLHPGVEETFTVLGGCVGFRVNGVEQEAAAGVAVPVPAGTPHDWWNAGHREAHVLVELAPAGRFEEMILNLFGLAQDGRVDRKGMPGLLQLAAFAREFDDVIRFTSPPRSVQMLMFGLLAPVARFLGYRGSYPEYLARGPVRVAPVDPLEDGSTVGSGMVGETVA